MTVFQMRISKRREDKVANPCLEEEPGCLLQPTTRGH